MKATVLKAAVLFFKHFDSLLQSPDMSHIGVILFSPSYFFSYFNFQVFLYNLLVYFMQEY